jgi:TP901 family phage tail tape measure protein
MVNTVVPSLDRIGGKMVGLGQKWSMALSLPLGIMTGVAVNAFAQFDDAMVGSTAIMSGVTEDLRGQMEAVAKETSLASTTSARDLAEGYYFLASAGRDAAGAMQAVATVDSFAIAGRMNMAKATEYLADAQSALGLRSTNAAEDLRQMQRVSDVITMAANKANASQTQFSDSLTTKTGPALRAINKELEEGMAVLMAYADQGIKGANAGEKINVLYRDLAGAFRENGAAWSRAGIALYDARGQMLPTADLLGQFEEKFGNLPPKTLAMQMAMLGLNGEVTSAIQPLLGLSSTIRKYEADLKNAKGATEDVKEKQMKSFSAQLKLTANLVNVLAIEVGSYLVPALLAKNAILRKSLQIWGDLPSAIKYTIANILYGVAVAGPALVAAGTSLLMLKVSLVQVATVAPMVSKGLAGIRVALVAMRGAALTALLPLAPYIAVVAALGLAIAGALYYLVGPEGMANGWLKVKEKATTAWNYLNGALAHWRENASIIGTWFKGNWFNILKDIGSAMLTFAGNWVSNQLTMWQTAFRLATAFVGWLTIALPAAWDYVMSGKLFEALVNGLMRAAEFIGPWVATTLEKFGIWAKGIYNLVAAIFGEITNIASQAATEIGTMLSDLLEGKLPDPAAIMERMLEASGPRVRAAMFKVAMQTKEAMDMAQAQLQAGVDATMADFNAGAADLNFLNTAGGILEEQLGKLKGPLDGFKSSITELPALVVDVAEEAVEDAVEGVDAVAEEVKKVDKLDPVITFSARKNTSFDAVLAGTSDAVDRVAEYMAMRAHAVSMVKGPVPGGAPGAPGASGTITHANSADVAAKADAKKALDKIEQNTRQPRNTIHVADANLAGA